VYTIDNANALVHDLLEAAEAVADAALEKHTELAGLGAMFLARASQSTHSAALLATNGLNGDAMSCARTVTEMSIDFAYIAKDPNVRIKKFSDYDHVAKFKIAKATDDLQGGTVSREAMRVLQQRHDTARLNNPESEHNWAGISIRKRAIEVGRLRTYELPYADMCNASHSCYGTLEYALVGLDAEPQIHFGPMEPDDKPIDLAFAAMFVLTAEVIHSVDLSPDQIASLDAELKKLGERQQFYNG
jgi:hypothetical protein